jgi:hypothetical protein
MFTPVDTRDPAAVESAVETAYLDIFPQGSAALMHDMFECVIHCFRGNCPNYQAIDAGYHDLEHTLQGALCLARLLAKRHRTQATPELDQRLFELGLLAMLLHDTGYAKKRDDPSGTGAKYTLTHVARSTEYAAELLGRKGFPLEDVRAVQNMIRCTGVSLDLPGIPFTDERERLVGYALGTADLIGQMAAPDYVDKLPALFAEFQEAAAYCDGNVPEEIAVRSLEELIRGTPNFWRRFVRVKIERDFQGLYHFLEDPYPGGPNEYLDRIRANLERIASRPAMSA